jgi:hypothetical protein
MSKFVKSSELQLLNGGYVSDKDGNPINNADFMAAQQRAEYVVTFAKHCKNKTFNCPETDSLADVRKAVADELAEKNIVEFVQAPEKVEKKLSDQLADEALKFMEWEEDSTKVQKINNFLAEFKVLKDFEDFGLFFQDGIVKLNKVYTVADVTKAVEETIDLIA